LRFQVAATLDRKTVLQLIQILAGIVMEAVAEPMAAMAPAEAVQEAREAQVGKPANHYHAQPQFRKDGRNLRPRIANSVYMFHQARNTCHLHSFGSRAHRTPGHCRMIADRSKLIGQLTKLHRIH